LFYTSGTTGDPKGVIVDTERALELFARPSGDDDPFQLTPEDRVYLSTPLFHVSAAFLSVRFIARGIPSYLMAEWKADTTLELIQDSRITFMWAVPTMLILMQKHPRFQDFDLSSLKQVFVGGSALSMDTIQAWKRTNQNLKIHNGYAQTETTAQGSVLRDEFILEKPGSIGLPNPGVEMKIVDDMLDELPPGEIGEIAIKSLTNMIGYYKNPELTEQTLREGWCLSGDTGYVDEDGFFYYTGRKKDMIIRGGENIFPDEIEAAINGHQGVLESAVIGLPDPVMGEEVLALVVLKPKVQMEAEEVITHCQRSLADYKVPKTVHFVGDLPKTSTLKINKKLLRDEYCAKGG
jgi:acyl-CoA synthetase (AMP-forming)/AMP-acid ligase II